MKCHYLIICAVSDNKAAVQAQAMASVDAPHCCRQPFPFTQIKGIVRSTTDKAFEPERARRPRRHRERDDLNATDAALAVLRIAQAASPAVVADAVGGRGECSARMRVHMPALPCPPGSAERSPAVCESGGCCGQREWLNGRAHVTDRVNESNRRTTDLILMGLCAASQLYIHSALL